ncbi:MAG: hypothetical protein AAGF23_10085, partial [Acidobacteriota bacterium]
MIPRPAGLLFMLLTCFLWMAEPAAADCCYSCCASIDCSRKTCADGTYPTPCCGVGKCNIFCCSCDGGCRTGPDCDGPGEDAASGAAGEAEASCEARLAERGWERFQHIDADRDGVLSREEVRKWMKAETPSRYGSEAAFAQGFAAADADGDGT